MLNQIVDIGTDIAAFLIFHPDDLTEHRDDPLDWWAYDFGCHPEFAAGRLIAFGTGADGGYRLRLTDGDLTPSEDRAKAGRWTFGYRVTQGQVFVDNGDCLPCRDARPVGKRRARQWVNIPNGAYQVTVQAIDRSEARDPDLPDYVLLWTPTDQDLATLATSPTAPWIPPVAGEEATAQSGVSPDGYREPKRPDPLQERYPLVQAPGPFLIPGESATYPVSDALYDLLGGNRPIFAPDDGWQRSDWLVALPDGVTSDLATLGRFSSLSRMLNEPALLTLYGVLLVRVTAQTDDAVPQATIEPVEVESAPLADADRDALAGAFAGWVDTLPKAEAKRLRWEAKKIAHMTDGRAVITRILSHLKPPAPECAEILLAPPPERAARLLPLLRSATVKS